MGLSILSKQVEEREDIIGMIAIVAYRIGARYSMDERRHTDIEHKEIDLYIEKHNGEEIEYFWIGIHPRNFVLEVFDLTDYKIGSYYGIAGTDNDKYPYLMYLFSREYLRLKPEHVISVNGETFFTLTDMERLANEKGYFENWCYTTLPWQNSEESV